MARQSNAFIAGAALGVAGAFGALVLVNVLGRNRYSRIVRLEKSLQIGRPIEEVFSAWADLDRIAQWSPIVQSISQRGDRSHWVVNIEGRRFEWDANIEQFIPNEAIGWKSVSGPKHTGRVSFSRIGNDTIIHVTMNYAPPSRLLRPFVGSASERIKGYMEQVLRDFKASLENKGQQQAIGSTGFDQTATSRATGTFGTQNEGIGQHDRTRFGVPEPLPNITERKS